MCDDPSSQRSDKMFKALLVMASVGTLACSAHAQGSGPDRADDDSITLTNRVVDLNGRIDKGMIKSAQSRFLELDSGSVAHVRDQGTRTGEVLVLVHGSNASLHTWEPWVALLGDEFRVITLDLAA